MIYVTWIGTVPEPSAMVHDVVSHLGREFGQTSAAWRANGRPEGAFDARRQQHSSRVMLTWLIDRVPAPGAKMLGITDVDLFIPVLTFVFGEAQLGGRAAVVSTERLRQAAGPALLRARLLKEAVHEVGHTFGLVHCAAPACVMARSPSVAAVDAKLDRLCGDCRIRLRELMKEQAHVQVRSESTDRR